MMNDIKVKCKRCGRMDTPQNFVMDPIYQMLVCSYCVKDRKSKVGLKAQEKFAEVPSHKAAADREDAELEKAYKKKQEAKYISNVQKISESKVKYKCPKCSYSFVYDLEKKNPRTCPYCSSPIVKFDI